VAPVVIASIAACSEAPAPKAAVNTGMPATAAASNPRADLRHVAPSTHDAFNALFRTDYPKQYPEMFGTACVKRAGN
jgi:hypothetical protein